MAIPDQFELLVLAASPFLERVGPLYIRHADGPPVLAVRIEPHHANTLGRAHGGLLMTVADSALSRAVLSQLPPGSTLATADLHMVFLRGVREGAWIEAHCTVDRMGRTLAHASCVLKSGDDDIAKAIAAFAVNLP